MNEPYNDFGDVMAAGDVDGNGRDELAVGLTNIPCPGECDPIQEVGDGVVLVFPSSSAGLVTRGTKRWTQDSAGVAGHSTKETFGASLVMAHFDDGGTDDLAVGAPLDVVSGVRAGSVTVLFGSKKGLTTAGTGGARIHQRVKGISGSNEVNDVFGGAVSAAYVQGSQRANLIVGSFAESVGSIAYAGQVHQLATSAGGPKAGASRAFNANSPGVRGSATESAQFGNPLG